MKTTLLFISLMWSSLAPAEIHSLSSASYLRKLSMHLRGVNPSAKEYELLQEASQKNAEERFFAEIIQSYLSSPYHVEKMEFRLEELFSLDVTTFFVSGLGENKYPDFNSLNELFRKMIRENQSWDELLIGKNYRAYDSGGKLTAGLTDPQFLKVFLTGNDAFQNLGDGLPPYRDFQFAPDDFRFAGSLTTSRFSNRYVTTFLNKNRRRAAAVFRIFMCDPMQASVPPTDASVIAELQDLVFPDAPPDTQHVGEPSALDEQLADLEIKDPHGQDSSCMACHYKLDPLGKAFEGMGLTLAPFAAPGKLVFKNKKGQLIERPGQGIGEVARAITEQPEYLNCQVSHFTRWFLGKDYPLTESRKEGLAAAFEKVGRKPNDFIAYLVTQPEFKARFIETEEEKVIRNVKLIFNRCAKCHEESFAAVPDLSAWPIGGSSASMDKWLQKIIKQTNLYGTEPSANMPPDISGWTLSTEEKKYLKTWIENGTPGGRE